MGELNDNIGFGAVAVGLLTILGVVIPAFLEPNFTIIAIGGIALVLMTVGLRARNNFAAFTGIVVGLIAGFYFWSPWWHGIFYGAAFIHPGVLYWLGVGILVALIGVLVGGYRMNSSGDTGILPTALMLLGGACVVFGVLIGGPVVGSIYAQEHMASEVNSEITEVENLSDVDADNPRLLPREVADTYARNQLQTTRHEIRGGDITYIDGTPHWSYSLSPDGGVNRWRINQEGAVFVDMTTEGSSVTVEDETMTYGQGMVVFDNYHWQLTRNEYAHDYKDPYMVEHDGELYMAVPYVDYDHEFRATPVPQVYSVPEFGGVALIDREGNIDYLSPEEAEQHPVLAEQRFYPYDLAHYKVNSLRYQHGPVNKWFYHVDELELAEVPGSANQPFTVTTQEGIKYRLAAEPFGENTHGIYQVYEFDARTGAISRVSYDADNTMFGPDRATRLVRQENPNFDWHSGSGDSESGNIKVVEPVPVVVDGHLYWHTKVVPTDGAGVAYEAFVNADTGRVTMVKTDSDARVFLSGESVESVDGSDNETDDGSDDAGASITITVEYPDGERETVTVPEGGTVTIEATTSNTS